MQQERCVVHPAWKKPGIIVKGLPTEAANDEELLSNYFEAKGGDVREVVILQDQQSATVEFEDPLSSIPRVLSRQHSIRKCSVRVEAVDLGAQGKIPYLLVRGFPSFASEEVLAEHFSELTDGEGIKSVEIKGAEAHVVFSNPEVALAQSSREHKLFHRQLEVELGYKEQEVATLLVVSGLPSWHPLTLKHSLEAYLNNLGFQPDSCNIIAGRGYVNFTEPSVVERIMKDPPDAPLIGKTRLTFSTISSSQLPAEGVTDLPQSPPINIASPEQQSPVVEDISPGRYGVSPQQLSPSFYSFNTRKDDPNTSVLSPPSMVNQQAMSGMQSSLWASVAPQTFSFPTPTVGRAQETLNVEDLETTDSDCTFVKNKVLVEGLTGDIQKLELKLYLESLAEKNSCTQLELHGSTAVATFKKTIDFGTLVHNSRLKPFELNNQALLLSPVQFPDTVIASGLPPNISEYAIKMYFEKPSVGGPVDRVTLIPDEGKAIIKFKNQQSVQKVLSKSPHLLDDTSIEVEEYCDLASSGEVSASPAASTKHIWGVQKRKQNDTEFFYLESTMEELTLKLEATEAEATLEYDQSGKWLVIRPLLDASSLSNWEEVVENTITNHFQDFKEMEVLLPVESKNLVLDYIQSVSPDKIYLSVPSDSLIIAGRKHDVEKIHHEVNSIIDNATTRTRQFQFPTKKLKCFQKFFLNDLKMLSVDYCIDLSEETITANGNKASLQAFEKLLNEKLGKVFEKNDLLSPQAYALLSSEGGRGMLESSLAKVISDLVYHFERVPSALGEGDSYEVSFLSPKQAVCVTAISHMKKLSASESISIPLRQLRVCMKNVEWTQLKEELCSQHFVSIEMQTDSVAITGEKCAVKSVSKLVENFLHAQSSKSSVVQYHPCEWQVINRNFSAELLRIQSEAKETRVAIEFPRETRDSTNPVQVAIRGDQDSIHNVVEQLNKLKKKVLPKDYKVKGIPGLPHVLESMRSSLYDMELKSRVVITYEIVEEEEGIQSGTESSIKICEAKAPSGFEVMLYSGNFAKHSFGGTMLNFLSHHPSYSIGNLKSLISAGGTDLETDLQRRIKQMGSFNDCTLFQSNKGQLKCNKLLHIVIPTWGRAGKDGASVLKDAFKLVFRACRGHGSIVIPPATVKPFNYPSDTFAASFTEAVVDSQASNINLVVYVEDQESVDKLESHFAAHTFTLKHSSQKDNAFSTSHQPSRSVVTKAVSSPLTSYITLVQGDMLQENVDAYINSTNESLDLSQGTVSKALLKTCGSDLQDECKAYAPLKPGAVVITSAKNLKCSHILHVVLPNHGTKGSNKIFRQAIQNVFRSAESQGIKSIAIPSLGVAGLGYPPDFSAQVLFEEVITFHNQYPKTIQKFHFVIYDKAVFQIFSKEYASHLSDSSTKVLPERAPTKPSSSADDSVGAKLCIACCNIADESTDVIVNTTTKDMNLSQNAVSKALATKAGPSLQRICNQLIDSGLSLEEGKIVATKACGQLRCKKVLHAHVPPKVNLTSTVPEFQVLLERIITDCLIKADSESFSSISFPAFGIGQAGYSLDEIAQPMLNAFSKFGETHPKSIKTIRTVVLDQSQCRGFYEYFCKYFNIQDAAHPVSPTPGSWQSPDVSLGTKRASASLPTAPQAAASIPETAVSTTAIANPSAYFKIYTVSSQVALDVFSGIQREIDSKIVKVTIERYEVGFLMPDDIEEISQIAVEHTMEVDVDPQVNTITMRGVKECVNAAKADIIILLGSIEKAIISLQNWEWKVVDDSGSVKIHPHDVSLKLERAHLQKEARILQLAIDGEEVLIDLEKKQETCKSSGKIREVSRVKRTEPNLPTEWEEQPKDKGGRPLICHFVELQKDCPEYKDAIKDFEATMTRLKYSIEKVERIQNPMQYGSYCQMRDNLTLKYQGTKVPESRVFHGTKPDSIKSIAHTGFNRNFAADANAAYYGRGVYFAVSALYSAQDKYSNPDASGNKYIFVCDLLVGKYTRGKNQMKLAPPLDDNNPHELYDTLVDDEKNPTIYVAMTDGQAYPHYLMTFKLLK